MSGKYSLGIVTNGALTNNPYAILQNPTTAANGLRLKVREVGFTTNASTLSPVSLAFIAAGGLGTASGSPPVGISSDPSDPQLAVGTVATTWSAAPTAPTGFLRAFLAAATAGSGYIWTFPDDEPLIVAPTAGLALWNPTGGGTGAALSVWFRWAE